MTLLLQIRRNLLKMDNPAHDAAVERASIALNNSTLTERVSSWVSKNQKALAIAAGVAVASGAGYYYYTSSRLDSVSGLSKDPSSDSAEGAATKKRSKKSKKSKSGAAARRSRSPSSLEKAAQAAGSSEEEKPKSNAAVVSKPKVEDENGQLQR